MRHSCQITSSQLISCALLLLASAVTSEAGVVLLYHHVDDGTPPSTSISPEMFERHLGILEEEGFAVVSLGEMNRHSLDAERYDPDEKVAAITFDDGYISIYDKAYPALRKRSWPFTIFLATDFVESGHPSYLGWEHLSEMAAHGATIANHSTNHGRLVRAEGESKERWVARVSGQIDTAGEALRARGFNSNLFAYPYGEYDLELLELVERKGLIGYGQQSGAIGPLSNRGILPRFPLVGTHGTEAEEAAFRDKIRSVAMPVPFPLVDPVTREARPQLPLRFASQADARNLNCFAPGGAADIEWEGPVAIIAAKSDLPVGRSRYNCTIPIKPPVKPPATQPSTQPSTQKAPATLTGEGVRYYWFSQMWMRQGPDGGW